MISETVAVELQVSLDMSTVQRIGYVLQCGAVEEVDTAVDQAHLCNLASHHDFASCCKISCRSDSKCIEFRTFMYVLYLLLNSESQAEWMPTRRGE